MRAIMMLCIIGGIIYGAMRFFEGNPIGASGVTGKQIRAMASETRAGESTDECPYGLQAMAWLKANGFAYTYCNMSADRRCEAEFLSYSATGTPYLIVRNHHLKDGFDAGGFSAALLR